MGRNARTQACHKGSRKMGQSVRNTTSEDGRPMGWQALHKRVWGFRAEIGCALMV